MFEDYSTLVETGEYRSGDFSFLMLATRSPDKSARLWRALALMQEHLETRFNVFSDAVSFSTEILGTAESITVSYYARGDTGLFLRTALSLLVDTINTTTESPTAGSVLVTLEQAAFASNFN